MKVTITEKQVIATVTTTKVIATISNQRGPQGASGSGGGGDVSTVNSIGPDGAGNISLTLDNIPDGANSKAFTAAEKSKLGIIEAGATANATNAQLRDRSTHTGQQLASTISDFSTASDARITAQKGAANGLAPLAGDGKISTSYLPAAVLGGMNYQGVWNASTNSPTLVSSTGTKGYYYKVNTAGTTTLDGINDWKISDLVVFNGTTWDKIDNTDQVTAIVLNGNSLQGSVAINAVAGPVSATDNAIMRYDGTDGHLAQNSLATISDAGFISTPVGMRSTRYELDNDLLLYPVNGQQTIIKSYWAIELQGLSKTANTVNPSTSGIANYRASVIVAPMAAAEIANHSFAIIKATSQTGDLLRGQNNVAGGETVLFKFDKDGILTAAGATITAPIAGSVTGDSGTTGGHKYTVGTTAPSSPAVNDVWIDTN